MKIRVFILLGLLLLFLIIIFGLKIETLETNPQFLLCEFNQQKYDEEMEKYNKCLEDTKYEKNVFGFFTCGHEPQEASFYERNIKYNLVKRRKFKLFGITVLETKRAYLKTCEDF